MNNTIETPKLVTANLDISSHAFERCVERFPEQCKNKTSALNHCRSMLKNAKYIGIIPDGEGKDAHFYVFNNDIAIYISIDLKTIISVYPLYENKKSRYMGLWEKEKMLYETEFRKTSRLEAARRKKLEYIRIKTEAEIAQLKLRIYKTRSNTVKEDCENEIVKLKNGIWKIESELRNIQNNKRDIAYAIAARFT